MKSEPLLTPEQSRRRHFEVERKLAAQLRASSREERTELFKKLYNQLFEEVPDHPRLVRRETPEEALRGILARFRLLEPFLTPETVLIEFAPGDCLLSHHAAQKVRKVYGIDISDQSGTASQAPANFELVVYDGYQIELPPATADVLFSYQFLEHLHPDDVDLHFELASRLLKPGGCYIFSTPHRFSGPHDISRHYSQVPVGLHFKEWTYGEMMKVLRKAGFASSYTYRFGQARQSAVVNLLTLGVEGVLGLLPYPLRKKASSRIFEGVTMIAFKAQGGE